MNSMFVAVDVGRCSVKVSYTDKDFSKAMSFEIPSLIATSYGSFSKPDSALVNSYSDSEISQIEIKETQGGWNKDFFSFFMFGKQARKQGASVSGFSEGSQFHKFGVAMILFVVSRICQSHPGSSVSLAINLTYSNNDAVNFYSSALKGSHKIGLGVVQDGTVVSKDVTFTIKDLYCFQQGYASIFNYIGTKEFEKIQTGRGVVIDIGRYTIDFSKIDELTLVGGYSMDYGTRHLITELQGLFSNGGIKLSLEEIEASFTDHTKSFSNVHGRFIRPWDVMQKLDSLSKYYQEIKIGLNNFIGEERVDYLILCGGGSFLIYDRFVEDFKVQILPLDYLRANSLGMLKLLTSEQ